MTRMRGFIGRGPLTRPSTVTRLRCPLRSDRRRKCAMTSPGRAAGDDLACMPRRLDRHRLPVDFEEHQAAPQRRLERRAHRLDARDHHALDLLRQLERGRESVRSSSRTVSPSGERSDASAGRRRAPRQAVGATPPNSSPRRGRSASLTVSGWWRPSRSDSQPGDGARRARGDLANQLVVRSTGWPSTRRSRRTAAGRRARPASPR